MAEGPRQSPERSRPLIPPESWQFAHLLDTYIKELNENDLSSVKRIFQNIVTADVKSWAELFDILCSKDVIYKYDIVYLQKIASHLGRDDLYQKTLEYTKDIENDVLHFRKTNTQIRQLGEIVEFHVRGHKCTTIGQLDQLRATIALILMVDKDSIKIAGVQEAKSVLIKFILSKMHVKVLKRILMSRKPNIFTAPIARMGVDTIRIDNVEYSIEIEDQEDEQGIDLTKIVSNLQIQLTQKENQIMKMEKELLRLKSDKAVIPHYQAGNTDGKGIKRKFEYGYGHNETFGKPEGGVDLNTTMYQFETLPKPEPV